MCQRQNIHEYATQYIFTTRGISHIKFTFIFFVFKAAIIFFNLFSKTRHKIAIAGEC
jgi:hypothetical protein